jgi:adenosylcobinamide-phosphate synthase
VIEPVWWLVPAALAMDMLVGDPSWLPHPVTAIGWLVGLLDSRLRDARLAPRWLIARGFLLWVLVVSAAIGVTAVLVSASHSVNVALGSWLSVWIVSTTMAANGLSRAAGKIAEALRQGDLATARARTAEIVGRDTAALSESELVRAAVESVAENTVDGVVSPMLYAALGGAPLAMAYRAVNTMDSMLGYKDEDYLHFGRAAARLDDFFNYVPARLTGVFMCVAAALAGRSARRGLSTWLRDARRHPSPNAGIPESVMAGSLGVQLGGLNYYDGIPRERARMGDPLRLFRVDDIDAACWMMLLTSMIACVTFTFLVYAISRVWL